MDYNHLTKIVENWFNYSCRCKHIAVCTDSTGLL